MNCGVNFMFVFENEKKHFIHTCVLLIFQEIILKLMDTIDLKTY